MSNICALAYVVVRGPVDEWRKFGTDVLGAQLVSDTDPSVALFRTDERAFRLVVENGPPGPDALVALGFEVANEQALNDLVDELQAASIPVKEEPDVAGERRVRRLVAFTDADGNRIEAHYGQESSKAAFVSPRGVRFLCGDLGVGHVFLVSEDGARSAEFYRGTLGFRLSDTIAFGPDNGYFLHCNPRHHSIAFAALPGPPPGINHLMLEVDSLEAVGRALDIVEERGDHVVLSLGEHSNDHMVSFYVVTPSGFAVEYGCNGLLVDDTVWTSGHYDSVSVWGHRFSPPPTPSAAAAAN